MRDGSPRLTPNDSRALVAVDLGAESCRVSLLRWTEGEPHIELVHRFPNGPVRDETGALRWPLEEMVAGVEQGLRLCAELAPAGIRSVAVDGWAVDYVRVDDNGRPMERPYCYRDERTIVAEQQLHERISAQRLYELTGVQIQRINTVYQLYADCLAGSCCDHLCLNLPEYLLSHLGGAQVAEYTNATHTAMIDLQERAWSTEILEAAGVPSQAMPRLVQPGTVVGRLSGSLAEVPAFAATDLIAPACHDTASAVAGIPARGGDWAYISSGTWSLVGTTLSQPCTTSGAMQDGYTNLGGVGGSTCFHRGINGMWLLKQCMNAWAEAGWPWQIEDLVEEAGKATAAEGLLDVDDPDLLLLGHMPARINAQRKRRGLPLLDEGPGNAPALTSYILYSLAARYARAIKGLEEHTQKQLRRIFVVGGGSRNEMLCRLTREATGLELQAASAESSTIGNFAVQLASLEASPDSGASSTDAAIAQWSARLAVAQ